MGRILIVDDDAMSRRFLREVLDGEQHATVEAADGATALALARATRFDWLVTDLRLPLLDGRAWIAALRADRDAASRATPALACSAEVDAATRDRLRADGFAGALQKPVPAATLVAWLRDDRGESVVRDVDPIADASPFLPTLPARLLDDDAGLVACGSPDVLRGLRELLAAELPAHVAEMAAAVAAGDDARLREIVHRVRGGCRFCGAIALDGALAALVMSPAHWPSARRIADDTLAALRVALATSR